jgi:hypothetical protein
MRRSVVVKWLTLLLRIPEVRVRISVRTPAILTFLVILHTLSSKCWNSALKYVVNASCNPFQFRQSPYYSRRWDSSVSIGVDDRCSIPSRDWEFFSLPPPPDRFWGPPSLLSNKNRGFNPRGVKRSESETDHSPPSSAKVKNEWSYTSTPPIRLHGVVLS